MKRYLLIIVILTICHAGYAQKNVEQLFNEFRKEKEVTRVHIGPVMMSFINVFKKTMGVKDIEVLDFDDCNHQTRNNFTEAVRTLKDDKYETMITTNEDGTRTKVLVRIEKDTITELIVLESGNSNTMVRLKGKIKPSDFDKVVNEHKNGC